MLGFVRISSQNCSFQFGVTRSNEWSQTTVSDSDESYHKGTIHWTDTHPLRQYPWYTHLGTSRCAFQFSWPKSGTILLRADEVQLIVPWNLVPYPCHQISFRPLDQSKSVTLHTFRIKKSPVVACSNRTLLSETTRHFRVILIRNLRLQCNRVDIWYPSTIP